MQAMTFDTAATLLSAWIAIGHVKPEARLMERIVHFGLAVDEGTIFG